MEDKENIPDPPEWPKRRMLYESDDGQNCCPKCGSSFKRINFFFTMKYCINEECENYYIKSGKIDYGC